MPLIGFQVARLFLLTILYAMIAAASFYAAFEVRFDFVVPEEYAAIRLQLLAMVVTLKVGALVSAWQLRTLITFFSLPDLFRIFVGLAAASVLLLLLRLFAVDAFPIPRGVILIDFLLCLGGLYTFRLGARVFRERVVGPSAASDGTVRRVAIIGADQTGASLARDFLSAPGKGFRPIAFFDDDATKVGQLLHGIPVLGTPEAIPKALATLNIQEVIIAAPKLSGARMRAIVHLLAGLKLKVEIVPAAEDIAAGRVKVSRVRPVEIEDLLGRDPVDLDLASIRSSIEGKTILVTGAAGSIGSELCRQIVGFKPARLLMLDQSEGGLFFLERELTAQGHGAGVPLVADILDERALNTALRTHRPHVVFHAAAYKHVDMMERHPAAAVINNTVGTLRVAEACLTRGVGKFVLISTDKAVNPTSMMGVSKRMAEQLLQSLQQRSGGTKFMAVRFGNVLGSSGSVVPIFRRQIAEGGPVTITHRDATRYFMTIPEAAGLVLQASVLGQGGEIFVLDMGQPVRILDLATQMIELSGLRVGEDIAIAFVGLRPGEKLNEELQLSSELHERTTHPKILRFRPQSFSGAAFESEFNALAQACHELPREELRRRVAQLVPEYSPAD